MGFWSKLFGKKNEEEQNEVEEIVERAEETLEGDLEETEQIEENAVQAQDELDEGDDLQVEGIKESLQDAIKAANESIDDIKDEVVLDEVLEDAAKALESAIEQAEADVTTSMIENAVKTIEDAELINEVTETAEEVAQDEIEQDIQDIEDVAEDLEKEQTEEVEETEAIVENAVETESNEEADNNEEAIEEKDENEEPKKKGFLKRLFGGLAKTRDNIMSGFDNVLSAFSSIDDELYEELEETLIMADFGVDTSLSIIDRLKTKVKEEKIKEPAQLKVAIQEIITDILTKTPTEDILNPAGPTVILLIGVNGVGKTTSIGKLSHLYKEQGKKVVVAAADTFRAAAIEQLNVWTERAGVDIIKHEEGSDAASVVFDAISAAKSRHADVLICDTAGRLQNKTNLMKELEKIGRIIEREFPEAKKEILIALDATTGQNAIQQVKQFNEVANISGIVLTKLDGTAKGGAIVGIYENLEIPVKFIGVGEKIDDLQPFDAANFAKALFTSEVE